MAEIHANGDSKSSFKIPEVKFTKLFINGEFVDSVSGKTFETIDPRSEEVIANIAEGDKEDIDLAVKAARAAFDHGPWPRMSGSVEKAFRESGLGQKKEKKNRLYVCKFFGCDWGSIEALDFFFFNLAISLLFIPAEFFHLFFNSFDAFEANKDLFWSGVFWVFSYTQVFQSF